MASSHVDFWYYIKNEIDTKNLPYWCKYMQLCYKIYMVLILIKKALQNQNEYKINFALLTDYHEYMLIKGRHKPLFNKYKLRLFNFAKTLHAVFQIQFVSPDIYNFDQVVSAIIEYFVEILQSLSTILVFIQRLQKKVLHYVAYSSSLIFNKNVSNISKVQNCQTLPSNIFIKHLHQRCNTVHQISPSNTSIKYTRPLNIQNRQTPPSNTSNKYTRPSNIQNRQTCTNITIRDIGTKPHCQTPRKHNENIQKSISLKHIYIVCIKHECELSLIMYRIKETHTLSSNSYIPLIKKRANIRLVYKEYWYALIKLKECEKKRGKFIYHFKIQSTMCPPRLINNDKDIKQLWCDEDSYRNWSESIRRRIYLYEITYTAATLISINYDFAFIFEHIANKTNSLDDFLYFSSYTIECLRRQKSVIQYFIKNKKNIKLIFSEIVNFKLHRGYTYKYAGHSIRSWDDLLDVCVSNKKRVYQMAPKDLYVNKPKNSRNDDLYVNKRKKPYKFCRLCGINDYICRHIHSPFVDCVECGGSWHICCVINLSYYPPTLGPVNKRTYARNRYYQSTTTYVVKDSMDYVCVCCSAIRYKTKQDCISIDDIYLFKIGDKHYFEKYQTYKNAASGKHEYYFCKSYQINKYYLALARWWNSDIIRNDFVSYDSWMPIDMRQIIQNKFKSSKEIIKRIWNIIYKKYPTYHTKFSKKYLLKYGGWDKYYDLNILYAVECNVSYWKTRMMIGVRIVDHLLYKMEHHLLRHIISDKICHKVEYDDEWDTIKRIEIKGQKQTKDQEEQEWDHTQSGNRVKFYCGYNYCNAVYGNCRDWKIASIKQNGYKDYGYYRAVLCKIPNEWPILMRLVNEFMSMRYGCVTDNWETTNQMQNNGYSDTGMIDNHFDDETWFGGMIIYKVARDSGLHLQQYSRAGCVVNARMFVPLPEGSLIQMTKWARTWFKHGKSSWMNHNGGSISSMFRYVLPTALLYPYPQSFPCLKNKPSSGYRVDYYKRYIKSHRKQQF